MFERIRHIFEKVVVMRPFGGDIFRQGCDFDSTADPSHWQFYK